MAGLKSFLYGVAPILGVTGAVLYERQRALVSLGVLKAAKGRGPGSGVPLTAENASAVIIGLLAAGSLSEVDERVVSLCNAPPELLTRGRWTALDRQKLGNPTFRSEVACLLAGEKMVFWPSARVITGIRVTRCWRGQILMGKTPSTINFLANEFDHDIASHVISITTEIEAAMFAKLVTYTQGALSQVAELDEEDDDE